jgi:glycosyltransferase involved in cell wall biosynthesis
MWLESRVVVVVPAYEEAPRVGRVVAGVPAWVDAIVVVDDASRDGTAAAARAVGAARVEVVSHADNRGVGAAIATGYRRAMATTRGAHDAFVVMAGDGQMDPRDLPSLVDPIARGTAEYVKGNRFLSPNLLRAMPATRLVGGLLFSWLTSRALGMRITDSQCGYTAIARAACTRLDLDALWPSYGYPNDLLAQLTERAMRIAETRVEPVYADEVSRLRPHHLPNIARLLARAWWKSRGARRAFREAWQRDSPERTFSS